MSAPFDWSAQDVATVCRRQDAVAVYIGGNDHLVIRQEAADLGEEDSLVVLEQDHAVRLAETILRTVGRDDLADQVLDAPTRPVAMPREASSSAAERSRRYRERLRQRDDGRDAKGVTRDGDRDEAPLLRSIEGGARAAS